MKRQNCVASTACCFHSLQMKLRGLLTQNFAPFSNRRFEFPEAPDKTAALAEVHLFTGVNGTGKSRLLSAIAALLGNSNPLVSRLKTGERVSLYPALSWPVPEQTSGIHLLVEASGASKWVGVSPITQRVTDGLFKIPAFAYSGGAYLGQAAITPMADVPRPERGACLSFQRAEKASTALLQALANLRIQAAMEADADAPDLLNGPSIRTSTSLSVIRALENAITDVTGLRFRFSVAAHPKAMLGVVWGGTSLPINSLPDGLRAIIGTLGHAVAMMDAWTQGDEGLYETPMVLLLDEIESQLHPAWQRKVLPAFQKLFPNSQIFIATHSPFIISSLNHGWIHRITLNNRGVATMDPPVAASSGDSYITVLEDIMGVRELYDTETEELLKSFRELRDKAFSGDTQAQSEAVALANKIANRGAELEFLIGKELRQMAKKLSAPNA